jgi:hypothetical protein
MRHEEALHQAADLCRCLGEIMRIKRALIIPAILTFAAAGSALAGTAVTVAPSAQVVAMAPSMFYQG